MVLGHLSISLMIAYPRFTPWTSTTELTLQKQALVKYGTVFFLPADIFPLEKWFTLRTNLAHAPGRLQHKTIKYYQFLELVNSQNYYRFLVSIFSGNNFYMLNLYDSRFTRFVRENQKWLERNDSKGNNLG